MAGNVLMSQRRLDPRVNQRLTEPRGVRAALIAVALLFLGLFLILPLGAVFIEAFDHGVRFYFSAIAHPATRSAIKLTLLITALVVPLNTAFGIAAAWFITRYSFRGKAFLITLVDLPFSVSPVIAGMIFVLLFGANSALGAWLLAHGVKIIFAVPGIAIATLFITFPFVARELIPLLQAQGVDEEHAALVLGANGWTIFWRVTLPKIKWGVLYGVILCAARSIGEFGAVSVVSGHIRGLTNTLPLHVEILYNEYNFAGAFAVASLLAVLSIATLIGKALIQKHFSKEAREDT